MDDQLSDANAREETRPWSPSDGRAAVRHWVAVARRGIDEGRKRAVERQRILDEQRAERQPR